MDVKCKTGMSGTLTKKALSWVSYPLVIVAGVIAHLQLMEQGISLFVATYVPVVCGALIITWQE